MLSCEERGELDQNPKINEFHPEPIIKSAHLCLSNESTEVVSGQVFWSLRHADGTVVREGRTEMTVPAGTSQWLEEVEFPEADVLEDYVSFAFLQGGKAVSGGTALFCAPKHFHFRDPQLTVRREGDELHGSRGAANSDPAGAGGMPRRAERV